MAGACWAGFTGLCAAGACTVESFEPWRCPVGVFDALAAGASGAWAECPGAWSAAGEDDWSPAGLLTLGDGGWGCLDCVLGCGRLLDGVLMGAGF